MIKKYLLLFLPCLLLACNAGSGNDDSQAAPQRFDIEAYKAVENSDDITGVWLMVQTGVRDQDLDDGYLFRVTGSIREIIEIKKEDEGGSDVYYQRNCLEPQNWREINKTDGRLVTDMGDHYMGSYQLIVNYVDEQRQMDGEASHDSGDVRYNAEVDMKKIAEDPRSFGDFDFYSLSGDSENYPASCFQEAQLRTSVSRGTFYPHRSEVHFARMAYRESDQYYRQAGYLVTLSGSPEENYMEFVTRNEGADPSVDLYDAEHDGIYVDRINATVSSYSARFGIDQLFEGRVILSLD